MNIIENFYEYVNDNELLISTAESCTAGLISSTIAERPGSSSFLDAGFITYSPVAKARMLNVSLLTIEKYNITSCEVAEEMAIGAILNSRANVGLSTTGLAGPDGGTKEIPVGTVCFGWAFKKDDALYVYSEKKRFSGGRNEVRKQAAEYSLNKLQHYKEKFNLNDGVKKDIAKLQLVK